MELTKLASPKIFFVAAERLAVPATVCRQLSARLLYGKNIPKAVCPTYV